MCGPHDLTEDEPGLKPTKKEAVQGCCGDCARFFANTCRATGYHTFSSNTCMYRGYFEKKEVMPDE